MVKQSDRAPLLDWEEIPAPGPNPAAPQQQQLPSGAADDKKSSQPPVRHKPKRIAAGTGWRTSGGTAATTFTRSPTGSLTAGVARGNGSPGRPRTEALGTHVPFPDLSTRDQWEEKDQIVSVFVVTFDTRSGMHIVLYL